MSPGKVHTVMDYWWSSWALSWVPVDPNCPKMAKNANLGRFRAICSLDLAQGHGHESAQTPLAEPGKAGQGAYIPGLSLQVPGGYSAVATAPNAFEMPGNAL